MRSFPPRLVGRLISVALCLPLATASAQTSVRHVQVLQGKDAVEIEIEASDRVVPQTQVLTGPDRLVIDFPNAVPGAELRSQSVYRGQVKDLRVGLFQSKPPITRIVLDLKSAQSYQIFPGQTVIIKVMGNENGAVHAADDYPQPQTRPGLVTTNYVTGTEHVAVDAIKPLDVSFRNGMLTIRSNKATLSEILYAVQQRTGAEIAIAAGAEQEKVVVNLGPGPAQDVLAQLLNGSRFNFLILNSVKDPAQLDRVILTPRVDGGSSPLPPMVVQNGNDDGSDGEPAPPIPVPAAQAPQSGPIPPPQAVPEIKGDDESPQQ